MKIGSSRQVGSPITPAVKNGVLILMIQRRQSGDELENVLAYAPHLVKRQATVDSYMHGQDCKNLAPSGQIALVRSMCRARLQKGCKL